MYAGVGVLVRLGVLLWVYRFTVLDRACNGKRTTDSCQTGYQGHEHPETRCSLMPSLRFKRARDVDPRLGKWTMKVEYDVEV